MTVQTKETQIGFQGLGISTSILEVLDKMNLETPTPIQKKSIPVTITGEDLIGVAQTGTGKTFAFGIPMLERLPKMKGAKGLILLPTRELASQVDESLKKLGSSLGLRTALLMGGQPYGRQLQALRNNPQIIIATPGRFIDHGKRGTIKLKDIKILVLDEADMMLDMGFLPQVEEILSRIPKDRQTMLFSATMPSAIVKLAANHMALPVSIEVAPAGTTAEKVDQEMHIMKKEDKPIYLEKVLKEYTGSILVFTRTKHNAKTLTEDIKRLGHNATEIHSNLSFGQRQTALAGFKSRRYRVLIATDIAARGIDVSNIELVLNYDLPDNSEDYVHRIGRTGRAGSAGKAISFAIPSQWKDIQRIEKLINKNLNLKKFAELEQPKVYPTRRFGRRNNSRPNISNYKGGTLNRGQRSNRNTSLAKFKKMS